MMRDDAKAVKDDPDALPRDTSRFKRLYPNGRAEIRDTPTECLPYMTTYEMALAREAEPEA